MRVINLIFNQMLGAIVALMMLVLSACVPVNPNITFIYPDIPGVPSPVTPPSVIPSLPPYFKITKVIIESSDLRALRWLKQDIGGALLQEGYFQESSASEIKLLENERLRIFVSEEDFVPYMMNWTSDQSSAVEIREFGRMAVINPSQGFEQPSVIRLRVFRKQAASEPPIVVFPEPTPFPVVITDPTAPTEPLEPVLGDSPSPVTSPTPPPQRLLVRESLKGNSLPAHRSLSLRTTDAHFTTIYSKDSNDESEAQFLIDRGEEWIMEYAASGSQSLDVFVNGEKILNISPSDAGLINLSEFAGGASEELRVQVIATDVVVQFPISITGVRTSTGLEYLALATYDADGKLVSEYRQSFYSVQTPVDISVPVGGRLEFFSETKALALTSVKIMIGSHVVGVINPSKSSSAAERSFSAVYTYENLKELGSGPFAWSTSTAF